MRLLLAGWLAGNQTKNPSKRNISLIVAELKVHEKNIQKRRRRPADINHRCAFRSSHSSYSGPVQGRLAGRAIAAIKYIAIVVGWRWEKETQATKLPEFKKNGSPNHTPNHDRIIPESYLKLPNSEPWYVCKIRTCVLWALFFATIRHGLHYASCCFWEKSDNSTLQRHPAMAPTCQLQSVHTTLTAAHTASTVCQLQSAPRMV